MTRPGMASAVSAFVIVVILVASAVAVVATQTVVVPGNTTGSRTSQSSSVSTTAENGLQLSLGASPSTVYSGSSIAVALSDFNTLDVTNSPSVMSLPTIGDRTLGLGPCSQLPLGFGIASGDYGLGNLSQASFLDLYNPGAIYGCPALFSVAYFAFSPLSDSVGLYSFQPSGPGNATLPTRMWTAPDSFNQSFSGYWTGQGNPLVNGTFHSFEPGVYTLVGADSYGQLAVVHFYVQGSVTTTTQQSRGTASTVTASPGGTSVSVPSMNGLELLVSLNATEILPGQEVQVNLSEFNTLSAVNNVSASRAWPVSVALGACENVYDQPFGIAVYSGHVDGQNLSQAKRLDIFPLVPCPLFIRLVTGYEFQPQSDLAVILPDYGGTPSPLVGSVNVGMTYGPSQGQPLPAGTYTVVAADEWGALAFVYFQVTEG
jgi:hypothetical protein